MPAGSAYPSGHLVPSPIVGLACAPFVEIRFLELAMSLLDFSPRIPLGSFSILLQTARAVVYYLRIIETNMFLYFSITPYPHGVAKTTVRYLGLLFMASKDSFF